MAHFLRFKVSYYQHPSVTHATITSSLSSFSRFYTPISPFYHLHSICQHSLTLYNYLPDDSPCHFLSCLFRDTKHPDRFQNCHSHSENSYPMTSFLGTEESTTEGVRQGVVSPNCQCYQ